MPRDRAPEQRVTHAAQSRQRRHQQARQSTGQGLDGAARGRVLAMVRRGHHINAVAEQLGVPVLAVWERARMFPQWGAELDRALMLRRDPGISHGSEWSYQKYRCRCPECREAKRRYR